MISLIIRRLRFPVLVFSGPLFARVRAWLMSRRAPANADGLSDHMLCDIGLTDTRPRRGEGRRQDAAGPWR